MGNRWGLDGLPLEAYSRVTSADRFQPVHDFSLALLARLTSEFDVQRTEGYGLDSELEVPHIVRPTVKLAPGDSRAAPIVVAFNSFPAIWVRFGRWRTDPFPSCGCDACDATAEGECERLAEAVGCLIDGRFREAIKLPLIGKARHEWGERSPDGRSSGWAQLDRARARRMIGGGDRSFEWQPWQRR